MPVASEPALGSVMTKDPIPPSAMRGNKRFFCSALPNSINGFMPWKLVAQIIPVEAQASLISLTQAR